MFFNYLVDLHIPGVGNDTYFVRAMNARQAIEFALKRVESETDYCPDACIIMEVRRER
jgi:hypothetical protein